MIENLVIVESPAKAKTIERFLGKEFTVKSSFGHIRDLAKKDLGIDVGNDFQPNYVVPSDKKKIVRDLKEFASKSDMVWLASDEDREGEAIAWHLYEVLDLKPDKTRRIVFHEITRDAIINAIKNPRFINSDLVNAQQARRILDRLVGFELSPLLWKKIKPALSAGRVQSVTVKLVVEKEREIQKFKPESYFRVTAVFNVPGRDGKTHNLHAELSKRFKTLEETKTFLKKCMTSVYTVSKIEKKPAKKSPAPPFTTSTLQQEAGRKLGFSVSQTMTIAQRLYESGKITYMRTDSVNLSKLAMASAANEIKSNYGDKYLHTRAYKTKAKGAQEAHEAIRPTYLNQPEIQGNRSEQKLYELIWKRTVASQMADALMERTSVTIDISNTPEKFIATGEVLQFDGFLKLYMESTDEEADEEATGLLPPLKINDNLKNDRIEATQKFTVQPVRYSEASLVKKLEDLGIGRPSTYAPTISTIQQREYVVKEDRPGKQRNFIFILLKDREIITSEKTENYGYEKAKLFPTDLGFIVNDFLEQHFSNVMNYNFTASVEKQFDDIAEGNMDYPEMIRKFYEPFHRQIDETTRTSEKSRGERLLGKDPSTGKNVYVKIGRYGPVAQIGEADEEEKPRFASLLKGQSLESITLDEVLDLFKLPKTIGTYENQDVIIGIGRYGPYVRLGSKFFSLTKDDDPMSVKLDRAIELINAKRTREENKYIQTFEEEPELFIMNGRYGPYISYQKKNYRIPKKYNPSELSLDTCKEIIEKTKSKSGK
ncbi:MAG: type I DNA topoisomerase [Bacteroidales bacterium]|nr:type I DNA topoisomerase [Bacteroidales bacterium]MBN2698543.1 type I DNA topoisomerase [Bacteroidales bacterium]